MKYSSNSRNSIHVRTYSRKEAVVFRKTREEFGGLSNMATGFPLEVNGLRIPTSEALYQACRFPHMPKIQRIIIGQISPMTAKMKSKPHRRESRADWDRVKVKIMRWCLHVKLVQNWTKFGQLLLRTGNRPIVEESRRDDFWGAKIVDGQTLMGINALGRLLMELREKLKHSNRESLSIVEPLAIPDFLLNGRAIGTIFGQVDKVIEVKDSLQVKARVPVDSLWQNDAYLAVPQTGQGFLFDSPNPVEPKLAARWGITNKLKPYPAYKDSGVPWLGDIPKHWDVNRGKWLFKKMYRPCLENDDVVTCFRDGIVTLRKNRRIRGFTESLKEIGYQGIRKGDFVIHAMDAFAGAIGVSDSDGKGTPVYQVLNPKEKSNAYYYSYTLREMARSQWILALAKGIRERSTDFRYDDFALQLLPIPSLPEQTAIVRYLDYMDRHIRRYINAKKKLIALLNEQKQVIIHKAVTRGLDPNVRLKPSGVEWLGDIPEHWEVRRLRNVAHVLVSGIDKHIKEKEISVWLCNYVDVYKNERITENLSFMPASASAEEIARFILKPGDIIITKDSEDWNDIGVPSLVEYSAPDLVCGYHLAILRPRVGILGEYLLRALQSPSIASQFYVAANGVTRYGLSHVAIKGVSIPVSPLPEQTAIVQFLNDAIANLDAATNRAQHEIDLLQEYRTCLIADVVTGKLGVREAAANLPEETEEPYVEGLNENDSLEEVVENASGIDTVEDEDYAHA